MQHWRPTPEQIRTILANHKKSNKEITALFPGITHAQVGYVMRTMVKQGRIPQRITPHWKPTQKEIELLIENHKKSNKELRALMGKEKDQIVHILLKLRQQGLIPERQKKSRHV